MEEMEQAHREHEILQGIITRHEGHMFTLRGWLLFIVGGLLAAYYTENILIDKLVLQIALVVITLLFLFVELQHMNVVEAVVDRVVELEKEIADSRQSISQGSVGWYHGPKVTEACNKGAERFLPRRRGMTFVLNQPFYIVVILVILFATLWMPRKQEETPPLGSGRQPSKVAEDALEFTLDRSVLKNVDDDAGRWQYSGGKANQKGKHTADYVSFKRVTFHAAPQQNTAMLTITMFFIGELPPQFITLQGTHDFNTGKQIGSVSSASIDYAAYIGGSFTTDKKTIRISKP